MEVGREGKTLDLDLSNSPELVVGVVDEGLFSDHRMFSVELVSPDSGTCQTHEMVSDWSKADMDQIAANLPNIDWVTELEGKGAIDNRDYVKEIIYLQTEKCVPKKRRRIGNKPLWMEEGVEKVLHKWIHQERL